MSDICVLFIDPFVLYPSKYLRPQSSKKNAKTKTRYNNTMKKDKSKREWILQKLIAYEEGAGRDVRWRLKNKVDYMSKIGKKFISQFVYPIMKEKKKPTGSACNSSDESETVDLTDAQWATIIEKCKWSPICVFYDLFRDHPTMGFGFSIHTGDDDVHANASTGSSSNASIFTTSSTTTSSSSTPSGNGANTTITTSQRYHSTGSATSVSHQSSAGDTDVWNSSSSESDSSDSDDSDTPSVQPPKKRVCVQPSSEPAKKAAKFSSSNGQTLPISANIRPGTHSGRSSQAEMLQSAMDSFSSAQGARLEHQLQIIQEENMRQREHDLKMAERTEQHSVMLQEQLMRSTAAMQESQQQSPVNSLQAITAFQADLVKVLTEGLGMHAFVWSSSQSFLVFLHSFLSFSRFILTGICPSIWHAFSRDLAVVHFFFCCLMIPSCVKLEGIILLLQYSIVHSCMPTSYRYRVLVLRIKWVWCSKRARSVHSCLYCCHVILSINERFL